MNITFIHGDNEVESRRRFISLIETAKSKGFEIINDEVSVTSLFNTKTLYVIENPSKIEIIEMKGNMLILCDHLAPAGLLKQLPGEVKIEKYDFPKKLFSFLDNINLKSFHEIIKSESIEMVFAMMGRQFRDLYWAKTDQESLSYPAWRINKLASLGEKFSLATLTEILAEMAEVDIKSKKGEAPLLTSIDLLISSRLE